MSELKRLLALKTNDDFIQYLEEKRNAHYSKSVRVWQDWACLHGGNRAGSYTSLHNPMDLNNRNVTFSVIDFDRIAIHYHDEIHLDRHNNGDRFMIRDNKFRIDSLIA